MSEAVNTSSSREDLSIQRRLRYFEWAAIALTCVIQLIWTCVYVEFDPLIGWSFLLLGASSIVSFFIPRTQRWRVIQLICQAGLISLSSTLGDHHYFYLNLYVLGAKAALLLPRGPMLGIAFMLVVSHIIAGQFALNAGEPIHAHRLPEPVYYRSIVTECQKIINFIISLTTVTFLGRILSSERKNLSTERSLSKEVEELAITLERARIAREIHDGLGHNLTSLRIQLELALRLLQEKQPDGAAELLIRCQDSAAASLQDVRRAVKTERKGDFSLKQAVNELVDQINQQVNLKFEIQLQDQDLTLSTQHQIFSIVQECLTNIRKHSSADRVEISLTKNEGLVNLRVKDNGKGFDVESVDSGFGLQGLRERAQTIGGTINIDSDPGKGTDVSIHFPAFSRKDSGTIRVF